MATHAVGHYENMSELPLLRFVTGRQDREGVLVMTTANPNVGQAGMLNLLVADHGESPLFQEFVKPQALAGALWLSLTGSRAALKSTCMLHGLDGFAKWGKIRGRR